MKRGTERGFSAGLPPLRALAACHLHGPWPKIWNPPWPQQQSALSVRASPARGCRWGDPLLSIMVKSGSQTNEDPPSFESVCTPGADAECICSCTAFARDNCIKSCVKMKQYKQ